MPTAHNRILTTHVGSLVRPPQLVEFLELIENDAPYDEPAYLACLHDSVRDVVRQQADSGVDIVSDGEFGKTENWAFYVQKRISGFSPRPATESEIGNPFLTNTFGRDHAAFPEFYAEYFPTQRLKVRPVPMVNVCNGPIKYIGHAQIQRDIANLKAALAKVQVVDGFLPIVAPASAFPTYKNEYYEDDAALLFALAEALHEEYKAVIDAGLRVQIDDAFLPYNYERFVPPMTPEQYRDWAQLRIDALNHALEGLPPERTRYHICWGSWNAPHTFDVPLKDIVDLLLKLNVGGYQFEAANVRHEHEWKVWQTVKLPEGKTLIPGVVSHATNVVEHPELIADRLIRLANIVGRENVMAGTDCGFAQGPFTRRVHPTVQWAKLRAQAEGAKLATEKLWGKASLA
jgi:5-methyltetrahydropteroyltriglutamate--homocysteine methyltransferase